MGAGAAGKGLRVPATPDPCHLLSVFTEDTHREEPEEHSLMGICPHLCDHLQTEVQTTSTPRGSTKGTTRRLAPPGVSSACT